MKTKYKFINFELIETKTKTGMWKCLNNRGDSLLGFIKWYPSWRQYCYFTMEQEAVYSKGCLEDIIDFINQLNAKRKEKN